MHYLVKQTEITGFNCGFFGYWKFHHCCCAATGLFFQEYRNESFLGKKTKTTATVKYKILAVKYPIKDPSLPQYQKQRKRLDLKLRLARQCCVPLTTLSQPNLAAGYWLVNISDHQKKKAKNLDLTFVAACMMSAL